MKHPYNWLYNQLGDALDERQGRKVCMKKVNHKELNNMILFLRVHRIAEFYYIGLHNSNTRKRFYDYISGKMFTRQQIIDLALDNHWHKDWIMGGVKPEKRQPVLKMPCKVMNNILNFIKNLWKK
tara:strand:- start:2160 stop:2534 length:375 start_codon:yes stop_codon:yes gene_type:complete